VAIRNYGLITSYDELFEFTERIHGNVFGFDIETGYHGPDREKGAIHPETAILAGISFTDSLDWARYVPLAHDDAENLDNHDAASVFWDLLSTGLGVAHNALFELRHLARWFLKHLADDPLRGEAVRASRGYFPIHSDTMVEAYLAAEFQRFGLKVLTKELFDHQMTELFELFPDLPKNKRKFLRFNTFPWNPASSSTPARTPSGAWPSTSATTPRSRTGCCTRWRRPSCRTSCRAWRTRVWSTTGPPCGAPPTSLRDFRDKFNAEIMGTLSELAGEPVAVNLASPPQIAKVLFESARLQHDRLHRQDP
jgi:hypothetical protein